MKAFNFGIYFLPLFITTALLAQNNTISGQVSAASGGTLANATVTLENITTGARQTVTTDASGQYKFENLSPGTYRLSTGTAQFQGTPSQDITLTSNPKTVNITVQGTTSQTITPSSLNIVDTTPVLDMAGGQIQNSFNTRYIQFLPQPNFLDRNGRAYGAYNLSLLTPLVTSSGGIGIGRGPVVGGQRPTSNNFNIDGIDNNNRTLTGPIVYLPKRCNHRVRAFPEPVSAGVWAFHRRPVQFLRPTGTNRVHGAIYDYLQNRNLNAMDASFARQGFTDQPRYDQNRMGGNVGLPLWKNNLFFFGGFEYIPLRTRAIGAGPIFAPTQAGYNQLAGLAGVSRTNLSVLQGNLGAATAQTGFTSVNGVQIPIGLAPLNGSYSQDQYIGTGSLDWNIRNSDQIRGRYVHNEGDANNNGQILPSFFTPTRSRNLIASVAEYHNFSSLVVNELRLGYNRFSQYATPSNNSFPGLSAFPNIQIQNLNLELGAGLNTPLAAQNTYQISDNVNWILRSHTIRFGFDGRRYIGPLSYAQFGNGSYTYSDVGRFLQDFSPDVSAQRVFGNQSYSGNQWAAYTYVNDSWQVTPSFNVNLGVRYQFNSVPNTLRLQEFNSVADVPGLLSFREPRPQVRNFAPRIGIALSPGMLRGTVFRAGFGMNYDAITGTVALPSVPPGYTTTVIGENITFLPGYFFGGALVQPTAFNVFNPTVSPQRARALTTSYIPDQKMPYTVQWNASLQQQVFNRLIVEARYLGVRGLHLPVETVLNRGDQPTETRNLPLFYSQPSQAALNSLTTTLNSFQGVQVNPYTTAGFTSPIHAVIPAAIRGITVSASRPRSASHSDCRLF
jgi:Predicted outer membrane protein